MWSNLVLGLVAASTASAHMQMSWPYPLHSTFNPATPEAAKDYSMTAPLGTYPCKGYINNPSGSPYMDSVATWAAGSTINATYAGTASHLGGSCQWSMSYDDGATWNVIHSYVGGCMLDTTIDVTIPSSAPSGSALFGWTWFNHAGNREMYMNCAAVTITGGGSGLTGPTPFVANVAANTCVTIENIDVVFPNPGDSIEYGGSYASSKPTTAAGYTGSNCVEGSSGSTSSASTSAATSVQEAVVATSTISSSATAASTEASSVVVESTSTAQTTATATLGNVALASSSTVASATASASATSTSARICRIKTSASSATLAARNFKTAGQKRVIRPKQHNERRRPRFGGRVGHVGH